MKAVVVNCSIKGTPISSLGEMENLLKTLDIEIEAVCEQNLDSISQSIFMGSGLLIELGQYVEQNNIDIVVFNNELSPLQIKNIASVCKCEIFDRSMVIIKIFELRASSKEARLQVEIAYLKYSAVRLIDSKKNYSQITSGGAGGLQNRGSGEKEINVKKFIIRETIKRKEEELAKISKNRELQRKNRSSTLPIVSIVGYTNAGKSTLMNNFIKLTDNIKKDLILEENKLFATLSTTTRYVKVKKYYPFLLTDTVGFIDSLPTTLIKAFRSTLEEILDADVLIHVVDVSSPSYLNNMKVTMDILEEIGVKNKEIITIYNKEDLLESGTKVPYIGEDDILTSLKSRDDMDLILQVIDKKLEKFYVSLELFIPYEESDFYFDILNNYAIEECKEIDYGYDVICKIDRKNIKKYQKYLVRKSSLGI